MPNRELPQHDGPHALVVDDRAVVREQLDGLLELGGGHVDLGLRLDPRAQLAEETGGVQSVPEKEDRERKHPRTAERGRRVAAAAVNNERTVSSS